MTDSAVFAYPYGRPGGMIEDGILGGTSPTGDPDSYFPEVWELLRERFSVRSFLDVGCGVGHAMAFMASRPGVDDVLGLEGSEKVLVHHVLPGRALRHDLTARYVRAEGGVFDMVWCCELAEHLDECYAPELVATLSRNAGKVLAFCAATPGWGGHHHVNCRPPEYWIERLTGGGLLYYQEGLTLECRSLCTANAYRSDRNYFGRSGLVFTTAAIDGK